MSKYSELADLMERAKVKSGFEWRAATALRELEAERDALWMRCQNYRLGGARTGDEWDALVAERDRLREGYGAAIRYIELTAESIENNTIGSGAAFTVGMRDFIKCHRAALEDKG